MVKDYSGSYVVTNCRKKKKKAPQSKNFLSSTKLMWKAMGAMLLVTLIIGVTSTFWYGWQVQLALDQIGQDLTTYSGLADENRLLLAQRNLLLTRGQMKKLQKKSDCMLQQINNSATHK